MVPAMHAAAAQLLEADYRSFARAISQITQGILDDAYVDEWIAAVPQRVATSIFGDLADREPELAGRLESAPFPVLLGQHRGCVMWTAEAFADAAAAVPEAEAVVCDGPPTFEEDFVARMRALIDG